MEIETIEIFENWRRSYEVFGLVLPDGWFGRPMDNAHKITWFFERENKFIIELDNQLYLILTKPFKFSLDETDLNIVNFGQFVFDKQGYGDMIPYAKIYTSGKITFVGYNLD